MMEFQKKYSFDSRKSESQKILQKHSDRLPVIVSNNPKEFYLDKHKYLVPRDLTMSQLIYVLRRRIKLEPSKAIFMFTNKTLIPTNSNIWQIYDKYVDKDGFLYIEIKGENTFGKK